jgi:hypothetical protein
MEIAEVLGISESNVGSSPDPRSPDLARVTGESAMNVDTELEFWRQQWQSGTTVPLDLRRKMERQSRFMKINLIGEILAPYLAEVDDGKRAVCLDQDHARESAGARPYQHNRQYGAPDSARAEDQPLGAISGAELNSAATRECVDGLRRTPGAGSLPGIGMIVTDIY